MKKETLYRGGFYLAGILSLAFGITLSTRAGLGISPITSFAYALAEGLNTSLGRMVLVQYSAVDYPPQAEQLVDSRFRHRQSTRPSLHTAIPRLAFISAPMA